MGELKCEVLPENFDQYDLSFKLIVIGDSGVGKSCLTMRATKEYFEEFNILKNFIHQQLVLNFLHLI